MKPIVILGAGGFAREVMWIVRELGTYQQLAFFDETVDSEQERKLHGIPVVKHLEDVDGSDNFHVICGTGSNMLRQKWANLFESRYEFVSLIHPSARLGPNVKVGKGTVITAGCTLTIDIVIGDHCNLNLHTTVGHDSTVDSFTNVSPGCHISGNVHIGSHVDLGTGVSVIPHANIGSHSVIGAGAVVNKTIPPYSLAVGVPAKVIKQLTS